MKNADIQRIEKYLHESMNNSAGFKHASRRTKIIATVGPACSDTQSLLALVKAGVNVFRLNFSHGSYEDKKRVIDDIRNINKLEPYNITILSDLQGPKLRVGNIDGGSVHLVEGQTLIFTAIECLGIKEKVYVSYDRLTTDLEVGDRILLDDGKLTVRVIAVSEKENAVTVKIEHGGILKPNKGFNLPDTKTTLPALTPKDLEDLQFIIEQQLDWVALSFVRSAKDIDQLRSILKQHNSTLKIIAKIEKPEAIANIEDIIEHADGVMIARGDLGVEVPVEKLPLIQKSLIAGCIDASKPVIVATQMMESMIDNVQLNRSEATDVANSVLDGADAVMLSAETATGKHPELVVKTMHKIITEVESVAYKYNYKSHSRVDKYKASLISEIICNSTCHIAKELDAEAIIGMTQSGQTAFRLSSFRPKSHIYVFTKERHVLTQLGLSWGVRAFFYDEEEHIDKIFSDITTILKRRGFLTAGNLVVHTGSIPIKEHLPTNMIKVDRVV